MRLVMGDPQLGLQTVPDQFQRLPGEVQRLAARADRLQQSLRVVDHLEQRYPAFDGLNLCFETREGILQSDRAAAEWVRANCAGLVSAPPEITGGPVVVKQVQG